MKSKILHTFLLLPSLSVLVAISPLPLFANESIISIISNSIPTNWELIETKENEIPKGHYWGIKYDGPKGKLLVFRGPADVDFSWKDRSDNWHKTPIAKEALEIWVMPPDYRDSWKKFFNPHRPIPAKQIFSGESGIVYGRQTHRIISATKFKQLLNQAKATGWPDSTGNKGKLSWTSWELVLKQALQRTDN